MSAGQMCSALDALPEKKPSFSYGRTSTNWHEPLHCFIVIVLNLDFANANLVCMFSSAAPVYAHISTHILIII